MPRKAKRVEIIPAQRVQDRILLIRGQRVIIDADLAALYGVTTKRLNEQVKRNAGRFPSDFAFRLTVREKREVVANCDHLQSLKFSPQLPFAFTEHGVIMAATILNSQEAVNASLFVVRAFVKLREILSTHQQLAQKLAELERKLQDHDGQIVLVLEAIRDLMEPPEDPPKPPIGFHTELAGSRKSSSRRSALKSFREKS